MRGYVAAGDPGLLAPSGVLSTTSSGYPIAPSRTSSRKLGSTEDQGQSAVLSGASTKIVTIVRPVSAVV
ncbi:hypothetical protein M427DRAFT_53161 [Gonapodya prolifera JEL478]|uniref:Uncharacterized protein n=1 Tax=Gonapodya prolifera (strain JEL478) TaxID=1344416 RepID=A0A139AR05_GONPJ|nr:hypothetical protein M427DRAFT_53161 [Gonapodya prolifera JEL478]|eukprot:KXS19191.1 hypothetical protein M427DRAFT_53161 [Gonapodya prolifera JEL478]